MFKVGDSVKLIKKDIVYGWTDSLSIGKTYTIKEINKAVGIRLVVPTTIHSEGGWWVPIRCVISTPATNEQLLLFELV